MQVNFEAFTENARRVADQVVRIALRHEQTQYEANPCGKIVSEMGVTPDRIRKIVNQME